MNYYDEYLNNIINDFFNKMNKISETKPEPQIQVVDTSTPKKSTNELLDDYIDLMTLYELFGDEGYKSKSEYILGLLKEVN